MVFKIIGIVILSFLALVVLFLILPIRIEMAKAPDGDFNFWLKVLFFKKNLNKTVKKIMDKKDNGVSFIVSLDKAYGFETGTPLLEVKNSLAGFEYKEENADDSNSFFLLGEQDATVLKYSFEENSVLFVFSDNSLTAVAVYSTENWNV